MSIVTKVSKKSQIVIPKEIRRIGGSVDFIETASPAITFVPCPVVEAFAMVFTGLNFLEVKYSVMATMPIVITSPIAEE